MWITGSCYCILPKYWPLYCSLFSIYSFLGLFKLLSDNGANNCTSNRLFALYHSGVDESDKKAILDSMSDPSGGCCVLFATIAFGMGINISNISLVIHLGPPSDIDDYLPKW